MTEETKAERPAFTDAEIQEKAVHALDRGAAVTSEALARRAGLLQLKRRGVEREMKRVRTRPDLVAKDRLAVLATRLTALAAEASNTELDASLARIRGGLASFPGSLPQAYGRVVDEAKRGKAGVPVAIVGADGKVVAKTKTDTEGYFSITAPEGVSGPLEVHVETETGVKKFALSRTGKVALPLRRILVQTPGRGPIRKEEFTVREADSGKRGTPPPDKAPPRKRPPSRKR